MYIHFLNEFNKFKRVFKLIVINRKYATPDMKNNPKIEDTTDSFLSDVLRPLTNESM